MQTTANSLWRHEVQVTGTRIHVLADILYARGYSKPLIWTEMCQYAAAVTICGYVLRHNDQYCQTSVMQGVDRCVQ